VSGESWNQRVIGKRECKRTNRKGAKGKSRSALTLEGEVSQKGKPAVSDRWVSRGGGSERKSSTYQKSSGEGFCSVPGHEHQPDVGWLRRKSTHVNGQSNAAGEILTWGNPGSCPSTGAGGKGRGRRGIHLAAPRH